MQRAGRHAVALTAALALALALLAVRESAAGSAVSAMGPFRVDVERFENCPGVKTDETISVFMLIHHNRTMKRSVISGNFTVKNSIRAGTMQFKLDMAKWDNVGGWREHFLVLNLGDPCVAAQQVAKQFVMQLHRFVPKFPTECPLEEGNYILDNVPADLGNFNHFPVLPYFKFRADAICTYNKNGAKRLTAVCVRVFGKIVPKESSSMKK